MKLTVVLWLLVWGGLYSAGLYTVLSPDFMTSPLSMIHGARAFLPILAAYLGFLIVGFSKSKKMSLRKGPLGLLFLYGLTGGVFFFLSPEPSVALYWAMVYLSVPLVIWEVLNQDPTFDNLHILINLNWTIVILLTIFFCVGPLRPILGGALNLRHYALPFGLGTQTANGVGRVAAIAGLVALSRLYKNSLRQRLFWVIILGIAFVALSISQSRAALVGFALGSMVLLWIGRKQWWLLFFGPAIGYMIWLSGFRWRAGGEWEDILKGISGREHLWDITLEAWRQSPFLGFGFHADRLLLEGQHVHMAFLHALVQSGIIGTFFFIGAFIWAWLLIIRRNLFQEAGKMRSIGKPWLIESIAVLVFLTIRSFFESTAAFYGIDLLILVPIITYIHLWSQKKPRGEL